MSHPVKTQLPLLAALASVPAFANAGPAEKFVQEFVTFCEQAAGDPALINLPSSEGQRFYTENADGSVTHLSMNYPYKNGITVNATRTIGATIYRLPAGVTAQCSTTLTDWDKPAEMLPGFLNAISAATPVLFGSAVQPTGGQTKDMQLESETWLWAPDAFPPERLLQASTGQGQISMSLNLMLAAP
ncbi:MAG: hypothetical protein RLZZ437_87 [Pseudomonadota bacterium]